MFIISAVLLLLRPDDISKTNAVRITKLFYDKSWRPIYIRVKSSKVRVTEHKKTILCWPSDGTRLLHG